MQLRRPERFIGALTGEQRLKEIRFCVILGTVFGQKIGLLGGQFRN